MQSTENRIIIASAGSRKTSYLVEEAIKQNDSKILILTYTNENLSQLRSYFVERIGFIPPNITILSWFSFLLKDGIRPYQNFLYEGPRIETIYFPERPQEFRQKRRYIKKTDTERYYFVQGKNIIADLASDFVFNCNNISKGLVIDRLERIYDCIFIDEVQDLAGWDLEILKLLLESKIQLLLVGDNRQVVYLTNDSNKNKAYRGINVINYFVELEKQNLCTIEYRIDCYRCNQAICDFADSLYPEIQQKTVSKNNTRTNHDGLFLVRTKDISKYIEVYKPQVLRYKKGKETEGLNALNFGLCKGQNYDRVLIFPTTGIRNYINRGNLDDIGDIPRFYVAITRARYSVAIVYDDKTCFKEFKTFEA